MRIIIYTLIINLITLNGSLCCMLYIFEFSWYILNPAETDRVTKSYENY